jgi:biotin carboxyl carrier protein
MKMKKYVIKLNDKVYEVEMGEVGGVGTVLTMPTHQQAAPTASAPAPAAAPAAPTATGGETIIAPMPGTIINVLVKAGDVVKRNQVLVVLEAMKMENEIVSPRDGTIISVSATKGGAVNVSEELVRIG